MSTLINYRKMLLVKLFLLAILFFTNVFVLLAVEKSEVDISKIGVNAAVIGMGGWNVAWPGGVNAALVNPSSLGSITAFKATSMYSSILKDSDYLLASGTFPLSKLGTFAISYIGVKTDADFKRDIYGNPLEEMDYSDSIYSFSWGVPLKNIWRPHIGEERMAIGATLKLHQKGWTGGEDAKASGMSVDLGYMYKINRWSNFGLVWKNIQLGNIEWDTDTQGELPSTIKLGYFANLIGIDAPYILGGHSLIVGGDIDWVLGDEGGMFFHCGFEYWPLDYFALRMGLDQNVRGDTTDTNYTIGLGLKYSVISFDYAFHPYGGLSENDTHYFSFSYIGDEIEKHYVKVKTPKNKIVTLRDKIIIKGQVIDTDVHKVLVNEAEVSIDKNKEFSKEISLDIGKNKSQIIVIDEYGYILEAVDLLQLRLISFTDVDNDYWASLQVSQLSTLGLINGYPNGKFKPEDYITRAELSTMLSKARNANPIGKPVSLFKDLDVDHWANSFVNGSYALGLVTGYPDGKFEPNENITRAEGIALIARFDGIKIPEKIKKRPFSDIPISHWGAPAIAVAKEAGLLDYLKSNTFEDKKLLTRAETVEILSKTEYVKEKLNALYDWDTFTYKPKEKIVVERQAVTTKKDKLKVIDDALEVQKKLKNINKELEANKEDLIFQEAIVSVEGLENEEIAGPKLETVYDKYLPGKDKKEKGIVVAAVEVPKDNKVESQTASKPLIDKKKKESAKKVVIKDTSEKMAIKKDTSISKEKKITKVTVANDSKEDSSKKIPKKKKSKMKRVFKAFKGAILGRKIVDDNKKSTFDEDEKQENKIKKEEPKYEDISRDPKDYMDKIDINIGPARVSKKIYIKCIIPEEAAINTIQVFARELNYKVKLTKLNDGVWAGIYNIFGDLHAGKHDLIFEIKSDYGNFPEVKRAFVKE